MDEEKELESTSKTFDGQKFAAGLAAFAVTFVVKGLVEKGVERAFEAYRNRKSETE